MEIKNGDVFDFRDPILPEDLVDQLFVANAGVPEHYQHIENQATIDLARRAVRSEPAHHIQTVSQPTEPQISA